MYSGICSLIEEIGALSDFGDSVSVQNTVASLGIESDSKQSVYCNLMVSSDVKLVLHGIGK